MTANLMCASSWTFRFSSLGETFEMKFWPLNKMHFFLLRNTTLLVYSSSVTVLSLHVIKSPLCRLHLGGRSFRTAVMKGLHYGTTELKKEYLIHAGASRQLITWVNELVEISSARPKLHLSLWVQLLLLWGCKHNRGSVLPVWFSSSKETSPDLFGSQRVTGYTVARKDV